MNNANNNPTRYGGKGMAMGGMITGGLSLLIMVGLFIFWLILTLLSS
jgi:hypothetical protein